MSFRAYSKSTTDFTIRLKTMNEKLISIFSSPMHGNGLDRVIINLSRSFAELGFKVDLIVPEITAYHKKSLESFPPEIRSIDLGLPYSKTIFLRKIIKLKQYLDQQKPTILLSNADYVGISNLARLLSLHPVKIVHAVHINVSSYFNTVAGNRKLLRYLLLKQFYRSSDGIIAVSKGVAEDISMVTGIPLERIQVIYNPVVVPELSEKAKDPVQHPWFSEKEIPIILGAGRLMHQKDFSTLIRAFAKVRLQRLCRLVIIGELTAHKDELQALSNELGIEKDVQFLGYAYNPYAYMAQSTVFVLSSLFEGLPSVLIEAMATGTPVVSTDCKSGPAEILENGRYGCLVPVGDANNMAEAILATLARPLDPQTLQQRAQDFTIEAIAKEYLTYFETLVS